MQLCKQFTILYEKVISNTSTDKNVLSLRIFELWIINEMQVNAAIVLKITIFAVCSSFSYSSLSKPPNILLFLTDDQDTELGGLEPLSKAKRWIAENGVTFENSFATIPLCCPSRASILTGLYQHNTQVFNNSLEGNCYGSEWKETLEKNTFTMNIYWLYHILWWKIS